MMLVVEIRNKTRGKLLIVQVPSDCNIQEMRSALLSRRGVTKVDTAVAPFVKGSRKEDSK
jgi:hypothetical protein